MYINDLGTRNIGKIPVYNPKSGAKTKTGSASTFAESLQKALEEADGAAQGEQDSCCEKCSTNSWLLNRIMLQSMYQSKLGFYNTPLYNTGLYNSFAMF